MSNILSPTETSVKEEVERGIALLDEQIHDWRNRVKVPINNSDANFCIIAQVMGANFYEVDLTRLGYDSSVAREVGTDSRLARENWAADFGFSTGEKHQKDAHNQGSLGTLRFVRDLQDRLWNSVVPVAA